MFSQIITSREVLVELMNLASLTFCPGLFEVINAVHPPSVDFFKSLPTKVLKRWGIYALVLEKPNYTPLVYVGSGTSLYNGIRSRFYQYDRGEQLPIYVAAALEDGYTIVHKGLFLWAPLPSKVNGTKVRVAFYAMEATLSFLFWAMRSDHKDYGMAACCYWPRDSFSYRGLCSHNALIDTVVGDFGFSDEQLEAMAAAVKEKNKQTHLSSEANIKMSQKYSCDVCKVDCTSNFELVRHNGSRKHLEKVARKQRNSPPKKKSYSALSQAKALRLKKYFCRVCDVACPSKWELTRHNGSKRHLLKVDTSESSESSI